MRPGAIAAAAILALCASPALAQTPPDLEQVWAQARAVSPAPLSLDREHVRWLSERTSDEAADQRWKEAWLRATARDAAARRLVVAEADLGEACIPFGLDGCTTDQGGYLNAREGRLYWQIQNGSTDEDGMTAGFVLLTRTAEGLKPVAWGFEGVFYSPPVFIRDGDDRAYVAIPGRTAGTGQFIVDRLYRWTPDAARPLTQIDNETWQDSLDDRLPAGLGVWQGVEFHYEGFSAHTSLWQDGDANCCATGGDAWLSFAIEGEALVLKDVAVNDALFDLATTTPTDIFDYARRASQCAHWAGEEPYDAERRDQISKAVQDLKCEALNADATALKLKYADQASLVAVITRADNLSN